MSKFFTIKSVDRDGETRLFLGQHVTLRRSAPNLGMPAVTFCEPGTQTCTIINMTLDDMTGCEQSGNPRFYAASVFIENPYGKTTEVLHAPTSAKPDEQPTS